MTGERQEVSHVWVGEAAWPGFKADREATLDRFMPIIEAALREAVSRERDELLTAVSSLERIHEIATERWRRGPVDKDSIGRNLDDIVTISGRTIANFSHNLIEAIRARESAEEGK